MTPRPKPPHSSDEKPEKMNVKDTILLVLLFVFLIILGFIALVAGGSSSPTFLMF